MNTTKVDIFDGLVGMIDKAAQTCVNASSVFLFFPSLYEHITLACAHCTMRTHSLLNVYQLHKQFNSIKM